MRHVSASSVGLVVLSLLTSLIAFAPTQVYAQQATAQIDGTVKDPSGAVISGAQISLRNTNTNIARNTKTNKDGLYQFTLVPIGTYELTVAQQGFEKYVRKGITLEINQNARLDVALQVGAVSQVVEVQGDVSQVDTVSATLGKVETTDASCSFRWSSATLCNSACYKRASLHPTRTTAPATRFRSADSARNP